MTVTFFGHRDCPDKIYNNIKETIIELIRNKNADYFYVGDNGYYDFLVRKALHEIKSTYTELEFCVVLAYMPTKSTKSDYDKFNTIYPDDLKMYPINLQYVGEMNGVEKVRNCGYICAP